MQYHEPLFRPPSEAFSLIFQITLGCSWNKCAFCEMYTSKKFKVRSEANVLEEISAMGSRNPQINKIFLADGNALTLSTGRLLRVLKAIKVAFPRVRRISAYASPRDLAGKSLGELLHLREAGLGLVYTGIESGDDELLAMVSKGETSDSIAQGLLLAKEAGIKSSVMILNGLGGKKYSEQHTINSARLLNSIQPEFFSILVLSFPYGRQHFSERFKGCYEPMEVSDLITEVAGIIKLSELKNTIFRSDHASNYLVLKGTLSRDKDKLLKSIDHALKNPEIAGLREEWQRGL